MCHSQLRYRMLAYPPGGKRRWLEAQTVSRKRFGRARRTCSKQAHNLRGGGHIRRRFSPIISREVGVERLRISRLFVYVHIGGTQALLGVAQWLTEEVGEAQGCVAGDGAPSIQDLGHAVGRNIERHASATALMLSSRSSFARCSLG